MNLNSLKKSFLFLSIMVFSALMVAMEETNPHINQQRQIILTENMGDLIFKIIDFEAKPSLNHPLEAHKELGIQKANKKKFIDEEESKEEYKESHTLKMYSAKELIPSKKSFNDHTPLNQGTYHKAGQEFLKKMMDFICNKKPEILLSFFDFDWNKCLKIAQHDNKKIKNFSEAIWGSIGVRDFLLSNIIALDLIIQSGNPFHLNVNYYTDLQEDSYTTLKHKKILKNFYNGFFNGIYETITASMNEFLLTKIYNDFFEGFPNNNKERAIGATPIFTTQDIINYLAKMEKIGTPTPLEIQDTVLFNEVNKAINFFFNLSSANYRGESPNVIIDKYYQDLMNFIVNNNYHNIISILGFKNLGANSFDDFNGENLSYVNKDHPLNNKPLLNMVSRKKLTSFYWTGHQDMEFYNIFNNKLYVGKTLLLKDIWNAITIRFNEKPVKELFENYMVKHKKAIANLIPYLEFHWKLSDNFLKIVKDFLLENNDSSDLNNKLAEELFNMIYLNLSTIMATNHHKKPLYEYINGLIDGKYLKNIVFFKDAIRQEQLFTMIKLFCDSGCSSLDLEKRKFSFFFFLHGIFERLNLSNTSLLHCPHNFEIETSSESDDESFHDVLMEAMKYDHNLLIQAPNNGHGPGNLNDNQLLDNDNESSRYQSDSDDEEDETFQLHLYQDASDDELEEQESEEQESEEQESEIDLTPLLDNNHRVDYNGDVSQDYIKLMKLSSTFSMNNNNQNNNITMNYNKKNFRDYINDTNAQALAKEYKNFQNNNYKNNLMAQTAKILRKNPNQKAIISLVNISLDKKKNLVDDISNFDNNFIFNICEEDIILDKNCEEDIILDKNLNIIIQYLEKAIKIFTIKKIVYFNAVEEKHIPFKSLFNNYAKSLGILACYTKYTAMKINATKNHKENQRNNIIAPHYKGKKILKILGDKAVVNHLLEFLIHKETTQLHQLIGNFMENIDLLLRRKEKQNPLNDMANKLFFKSMVLSNKTIMIEDESDSDSGSLSSNTNDHIIDNKKTMDRNKESWQNSGFSSDSDQEESSINSHTKRKYNNSSSHSDQEESSSESENTLEIFNTKRKKNNSDFMINTDSKRKKK